MYHFFTSSEVTLMKVLILSSNQETVNQISFFLRIKRADTAIVSCTEDSRSIESTITETPNLIIVDRLPGLSYLGLVHQIRDLSDVPLIVLMQDGAEMNRAEVIEAGADECIIKPYSSTDLLAKTDALLRRTGWCGFKGYHRTYVSS